MAAGRGWQDSDKRKRAINQTFPFQCRGRRGLVVKAAGWLSLDRQFEPYLRANTVTGALVVWPATFPNLDGRIHQSPV
jgi:hypothetical protein